MIEYLFSILLKRKNRKIFKLEPTSNWTPKRKKNSPLMLYIHIPFCSELCPYCSFHRVPFEEGLTRMYFEALKKEVLLYRDLGYNFKGLYIGGGTPTILMDELIETVELIKGLFDVEEISIETNPNHLTEDNIEILRALGTKRLSVGVQSFDNSILRAIKRYHKYGSGESIAERLLLAKGRLPTLNVDMIFNFPFQTKEMFEHDLRVLLSLQIDQITYYPLMVSEVTIREIERTMGRMDYKKERSFYEILCEALLPSYEQRTVWCFSRTKGLIDEYVINFDEYAGLGSGSIGYIDGVTYANTFNIAKYIKMLEEKRLPIVAKREFSKKERILYDFLMKFFGLKLDLRELRKKYGSDVKVLFPLLLFFLSFRLIEKKEESFILRERGKYLFLVLMREFFTAVNNFRDYLRTNQ